MVGLNLRRGKSFGGGLRMLAKRETSGSRGTDSHTYMINSATLKAQDQLGAMHAFMRFLIACQIRSIERMSRPMGKRPNCRYHATYYRLSFPFANHIESILLFIKSFISSSQCSFRRYINAKPAYPKQRPPKRNPLVLDLLSTT